MRPTGAPNFKSYGSGFAKYYGHATAGGSDVAKLHDSAGNDEYKAWANGNAQMDSTAANAPDAWVYGFEENDGIFDAGGPNDDDVAYLYGSDVDDRLNFGSGNVDLRTKNLPSPYLIHLESLFERVYADAGTGGNNDEAWFNGTSDPDTFLAQAGDSQMTTGGGKFVAASGFETTRAYTSTSEDGYDKAYLTGSTGNDTFSGYGKPREYNLFAGMGRLSGTGYLLEVYQFEEVYVDLLTGNDTAKLYDGTGNDYFWGKLGVAVLTNGTVDDATGGLVTPGTYYYKVYGFDSAANDLVKLYGTEGGTNTKKVITPLDYLLATYGSWIDAP
jgi:hypothetical protein